MVARCWKLSTWEFPLAVQKWILGGKDGNQDSRGCRAEGLSRLGQSRQCERGSIVSDQGVLRVDHRVAQLAIAMAAAWPLDRGYYDTGREGGHGETDRGRGPCAVCDGTAVESGNPAAHRSSQYAGRTPRVQRRAARWKGITILFAISVAA